MGSFLWLHFVYVIEKQIEHLIEAVARSLVHFVAEEETQRRLTTISSSTGF